MKEILLLVLFTFLMFFGYNAYSENRYTGIYRGVIYEHSDEVDDYTITMLLSHDMKAVMFAEYELAAFGYYMALGSAATLTCMDIYSVYPMEPFTFTLSGFGPVSPKYGSYITFSVEDRVDEIEGEFVASGSLYRRGVSLGQHIDAQTAEDMVTGETGWADLWPTGHFAGELDQYSGCRYEGDLTIPDADFNLFDVTLTVTECGGRNGFYTGMGYQADAHVIDDGAGIWIITSNNQRPFVLWLNSLW